MGRSCVTLTDIQLRTCALCNCFSIRGFLRLALSNCALGTYYGMATIQNLLRTFLLRCAINATNFSLHNILFLRMILTLNVCQNLLFSRNNIYINLFNSIMTLQHKVSHFLPLSSPKKAILPERRANCFFLFYGGYLSFKNNDFQLTVRNVITVTVIYSKE